MKDNSLKEKFLTKAGWGMPIDPLTKKIQFVTVFSALLWFAFGFYLKYVG